MDQLYAARYKKDENQAGNRTEAEAKTDKKVVIRTTRMYQDFLRSSRIAGISRKFWTCMSMGKPQPQ